MNARVEAMVEQAKVLSAEERVALLDALVELANPPDSDWQAAWAKACDDRLEAYERGDIEAEDFDVAMAWQSWSVPYCPPYCPTVGAGLMS